MDANRGDKSKALEGGQLGVQKHLPGDLGANDCQLAATGGHPEVLKYLHENGRRSDASVSVQAASSDQLEVPKGPHKNGWSWDVEVDTQAAMNGHLAVLNYLLEKGLPWDPNAPVPQI